MAVSSLSRPLPPQATRYAKALYEIASEQRELEAVESAVASFDAMLRESAELKNLLTRPLTSRRTAARAVAALLEKTGAAKLARDFFKVAILNGRARDIPQILEGFAALAEEKRGVIRAQVISARPLSPEQEKAIQEALKAALGKRGVREVKLDKRVEKDALGGLSVQVGSLLYAGTLSAKLQKIGQAIK
jgi:F-type H+-transporting ATPase subunit delta